MSSIPTNCIPPTIPFHVAQAYGVPVSRANSPADRVAAAAAGAGSISGVASASIGPASKLPTPAQKLVGATVPGRVDFSGETPQQVTASAFALYTRPADKNAAATAVQIGRSLDVRG